MNVSGTLELPLSSPARRLNEPSPISWREARWAAFLSPLGGRVFGAVAGEADVWRDDPFDEESIHAGARQAFSDTLDAMADRERGATRGAILLLQGDAGSGKTHLMGALRRTVEERGAGYFTYAQMTTGAPSLWHYLLRNVVDGLQRRTAHCREGAWLRLSDALVERPAIPPEERDALRTAEDYYPALEAIRARLPEDLKGRGPEETLHADFLSALLALQRRDGNAHNAAMKYFAGDHLSDEEAAWLCCPHGPSGQGDAHRLFDWLLRAIRTWGPAQGSAFVLCIDQIEELYERDQPQQQRFPDMVATVCSLTDRHPGLIVVLACLSDLYEAMKRSLIPTHRDRVEAQPPAPVILTTERTEDEVAAIVRRRLELLDAEAGIDATPDAAAGDDPLFPFTRENLARLRGSRPRSILVECHAAWARSRRSGEAPEVKAPMPGGDSSPSRPTNGAGTVERSRSGRHENGPQKDGSGFESQSSPNVPEPRSSRWPQLWNDFRTTFSEPLSKQPADLAAVLAWGVQTLARQTGAPISAEPAADLVHLTRDGAPATAAICHAPLPGGKLLAQLRSLQKLAADSGRAPLAVRATEFAKGPKAQVNLVLGEMRQLGGGRVIFPEADWRALQAWRAFAERHAQADGFAQWERAERPLASVSGLRELVQLDALLTVSDDAEESERAGATASDGRGKTPSASDSPAPTDPGPSDARLDLDPASILLGVELSRARKPITLTPAALTQHLAVLGGTGSGKTTLAMTLIEGLLLRGIPAILVDRKGDLARYADRAALDTLLGPAGALFRERVDVALFTPGADAGRPLALSVLPARLPGATSQEIRTQAEDAAHAFAAMLGYRDGAAHNARRAALVAAIQVLLELDDTTPTLTALLDLMGSEDPALLQALDPIDPRHLRQLVQDVASFRSLHARLLAAGTEPLDAARLLAVGPHAVPGKTRLCVISTKFLGADDVIQFWVAQLMLELARFASAHPSRDLQAAVMLDEADLYLPATGKPASKLPIENALRRFRSQGIGIILASQNPGDFDYKSRGNILTWLVGKVTQTVSQKKLAPVFGEAGGTHLERLPQHATGEFCLVREDRTRRFQAQRNLLTTDQMSDAEILRAAQMSRSGGSCRWLPGGNARIARRSAACCLHALCCRSHRPP
jgi:hypothetical protein